MDEEIKFLKNLKDRGNFDEFIDKYSLDILKTISYVLNLPYEKPYIEECFDDVVMKIASYIGFIYKGVM